MIKRAFYFVLWIPLLAFAQTDCVNIADDKERLDCFDKANGVVKPPQETKFQNRPSVWAQRIKIRSDGAWDNLGKDPAVLSMSSVNGEDASQIKAAMVVLGPASSNGWQPFGSFGVNRDTLTKSKSDIRTLTAGISGTIFDYLASGFSLWSTPSLSGRENIVDHTASTVLRLDNYVAIKGLADGIPFSVGKNDFRLLPRFGFQSEDQRKVKAGSISGRAQGAFLGFRFDYWPGQISQQVQLTALSQFYRDSSIDAGMTKRSTKYHKISMDYYFYDQNDKNAWFQPALGIGREVGEDPVFGVPNAGRTQIGLKLKIN